MSFRGSPRRDDSARDRAPRGLRDLVAGLPPCAVPISRAGVNEIVRFLLPLGISSAALVWREWRHGDTAARECARSLFETLGPFALGALFRCRVTRSSCCGGRASADDRRRADQTVPAGRFGDDASAAADRIDVFDGPGFAAGEVGESAGRTILASSAARCWRRWCCVRRPSRHLRHGVFAAWGLPLLAAVGAAWLMVSEAPERPIDRRTRPSDHRHRLLDVVDRVSLRRADLSALHDSVCHAGPRRRGPRGRTHPAADAIRGGRLPAGIRAGARDAGTGRVLWRAVHCRPMKPCG